MAEQRRYEVLLAPAAKAVIDDLRTSAKGKPQSARATTYVAIKRLLQVLSIPEHAGDGRYAMHAPLAGVCRIKHGRFRLLYIHSRVKRKLLALYVGYRKEGDKHDVYSDFARRLRRGEFDAQFDELGLRKPNI